VVGTKHFWCWFSFHFWKCKQRQEVHQYTLMIWCGGTNNKECSCVTSCNHLDPYKDTIGTLKHELAEMHLETASAFCLVLFWYQQLHVEWTNTIWGAKNQQSLMYATFCNFCFKEAIKKLRSFDILKQESDYNHFHVVVGWVVACSDIKASNDEEQDEANIRHII
jgi:hypothetical protein